VLLINTSVSCSLYDNERIFHNAAVLVFFSEMSYRVFSVQDLVHGTVSHTMFNK